MDRLKATELGTLRGTERSLGRCLCSDDSLLGLVFPGVRVTILLSFHSRSQLMLVLPSRAQTSNPHPRTLVPAGLGDIALASTLPRRPIPVHPTVPAPPHSPPALPPLPQHRPRGCQDHWLLLPSGFSLLLSLTPSVAPYFVKALFYFLSPLLLLLSGSPPPVPHPWGLHINDSGGCWSAPSSTQPRATLSPPDSARSQSGPIERTPLSSGCCMLPARKGPKLKAPREDRKSVV